MIESLKLTNFRNHETLSLSFNKNFVYITGKNGSGKTSVLEAINYVATTKSHRTNTDLEVIKRGEQFSKITLKTKSDLYEVIISEKGKICSLNKKELRKLSDFIAKLKVIFFAPEDLSLIKGSPGLRRNFINIELTKINQGYLNNLTRYNNILKQRNALLKNIKLDDDLTFLNILGNQLYEVGKLLIEQRSEFIKRLNEVTKKVYQSFNDVEIDITYLPSVSSEGLLKHFTKNQKIDILYETTTSGPHRDDFLVKYNNNEAVNASQGEIRLIVIAIKLALVEIIKTDLKVDVVLLLDDVFSELDSLKQKTILNNLPKDLQVIMNSAISVESNKIEIIQLGDNVDNEQ